MSLCGGHIKNQVGILCSCTETIHFASEVRNVLSDTLRQVRRELLGRSNFFLWPSLEDPLRDTLLRATIGQPRSVDISTNGTCAN